MLKCLLGVPDDQEVNECEQRVGDIQEDQQAYGDYQVPLVALPKQDEEANVQVRVESCNLTHQKFNYVPFVKL